MLAVETQAISVVVVYISAYLALIPLLPSNVYEERSLGIYKRDLETRTSEKEAEDGVKGGLETKLFFLRQQLQHHLAHNIWWLSISIVFIFWIKGRHRGLPIAIDKAVLLPGEISGSREGTDRLLQNVFISV